MSGPKRRVSHRRKPLGAAQSSEIGDLLRQALALHQQAQLARAAALYAAILKRAPDHFDALHLLGVVEAQRKNFAAAVELIGKALKISPQSAPAHTNIGNALLELGRHEEALVSYDRALALKPDDTSILSNRGNALAELDRFDEALASYDRALAIKPDDAKLFYNRCKPLCGLKRYEEALASYDRALAIQPDYPEALTNRGNALLDLNRHDEALASYDRALAIKPDYAEALNNRGIALRDLRRHEEAAKTFERLLEISPDYNYARGHLLSSQLYCCDWKDYHRNVEQTIKDVVAGKRSTSPFTFLSISESPAAQLQCAQTYNQDKYAVSAQPTWQGERYHHPKIRVAYLSADFGEHVVAYLMGGLFEAHDKEQFETTAISFGADRKSEMRIRLEGAFTRFIDVRSKSDRDIALLLKELEIDIAVDLMGYTTGGRMGIFGLRPAPLQVNYLGYLGTTGAEYIDYILADRMVISEGQEGFFTEQIVYLPDTFMATDATRRTGEHTPTRLEVGLPETGFVFCSFNNNYKITPSMFDVWMRLLHQVEGSVLWLLEENAAAVCNRRQEAARRGIGPDRLIFAPRVKPKDHLARHRLAGLFLDTLPYNAGGTAIDALWAGLPVVTCVGSSFVGRMAGSLLNAVGLPELITYNLADYEALALRLASDANLLAEIKAKLARNRATFPLFDTDRFRRHIESAYQTMWQRHQRGEPPASFAVAPQD